MVRKVVSFSIIGIIGIIAGFIFLLRGCLSQFDERAVIAPPLLMKKNAETVVVSLVKFDKTNSYRRSGGFVSKSVSTSYYLETINGENGQKIGVTLIAKGRDIKSYPVEFLGEAGNLAWLFAGQLIAYDPFTLERKADKNIIESKNPRLKEMLPNERRFYSFDASGKAILFTALDGNRYRLDPNSFTCEPVAASNEDGGSEKEMLEQEQNEIRDQINAGYDTIRSMNQAYRDKKISIETYTATIKPIQDSIRALENRRRILDEQIRGKKQVDYDAKSLLNKIASLKGFPGFSHSRVNTDTVDGNWFALGTPEWIREQNGRYSPAIFYNDAAQNRLYKSSLKKDVRSSDSYYLIDDNKGKLGEQVFLQGGFLIDPETAEPIRVGDPKGYLVVYTDKIGNQGMIKLARIDRSGNLLWDFNTNCRDIKWWRIRNNRLFVMSVDNSELSGNELNLLIGIDIRTGKAFRFDYFKDEIKLP